jgi:hypothetical protein
MVKKQLLKTNQKEVYFPWYLELLHKFVHKKRKKIFVT